MADLELSNIHFAYRNDRPVLQGLDFALDIRERIALHGANGSGKSTLLQIIVGLLTPTRGELRIFNKPRRREADFLDVRQRIGLLFQDPDDQLFCPTVLEDVAFGPLNLGQSRHEAKQTALRTLDQLGMDGFDSRVTTELSFGEKRMVALAGVLAMQPEMLLLDEPTANLDEAHRQRLLTILAESDCGFILVSHEYDSPVCSRKITLEAGRIDDDRRA